ncbi:hypothetical protein [Enterococcus wangshanyuanii]|uniref:Conjugal transfer protein TrbC n=1 Tax=Enterococcus wangshanyuanii TaxID=2005703 RepID=A0ABQ1PRE3_9ENTE|nr:hypothetical protein [Enterococcus wangshanyuanii]GGD01763.1 hypothetical protein GCM10011573_34110 [Enterococcus wangshanyuanii]
MMKRIAEGVTKAVIDFQAAYYRLRKKKYYGVIVASSCLAIACFFLYSGGITAFADIQSSATLAETETNNFIKIIGNSALFICLLLFGASQYFGTELGRWGKKLMFGAILGSAVILNASSLRDLIWGNVGG